jgi:hypothetical protein
LDAQGETRRNVEWIRDDAFYFNGHRFQSLWLFTPPTDVFDIFRCELGYAYSVRVASRHA